MLTRSHPEGVAFAALHHRDFRMYFAGTMLAMMADNMEHVMSYWLLYESFRSPVLGGFAVLSHWTPSLLFSVYFGALADRFDCRKIIMTGQVMFMGVSLAWGILFFTGAIQVWHAMALLVVHGMASVLWGPGSQLLIHDIVGSEHLQSAIRLSAISRQLGFLLGPAVGGALMLLLTPAIGLMANALVYLPLTVWLLKVSYTGHHGTGIPPASRSGTGLKDAMQLLQEVSGNRPVLSMVLLAGLSSLFVGNAFQAQMPEYAHDLGTDREGFGYSALLGANAAGAIIGGLLLEGRGLLQPGARNAIVCTILWCFAITGFALVTSYPLALILLLLAGILNIAFYSMAQTLVQLEAPPNLRGRLVGLFQMSGLGLRAFSGVTVGMLGGLIGVHWSLGLSAMALLAATIVLFAFTVPSSRI